MTLTLLLVRHGQIEANRRREWHGAIDSPLTAIGRRQADRVAARLREAIEHVEAVYTSPLARCLRTADPLARAFERAVSIDDDLREYSIGELEGTPFKTLQSEHTFFDRIRNPDYRPRGGESLRGVAERMERALRRIEAEHRDAAHVVVVSHGAALAVALASLLDADPTRWTNYAIANASITELTFAPKLAVPSFNRTDHL
jgi:broad specificity phosphatase PhoE